MRKLIISVMAAFAMMGMSSQNSFAGDLIVTPAAPTPTSQTSRVSLFLIVVGGGSGSAGTTSIKLGDYADSNQCGQAAGLMVASQVSAPNIFVSGEVMRAVTICVPNGHFPSSH
jgi:hypothetical protein